MVLLFLLLQRPFYSCNFFVIVDSDVGSQQPLPCPALLRRAVRFNRCVNENALSLMLRHRCQNTGPGALGVGAGAGVGESKRHHANVAMQNNPKPAGF